MAAQRRGGSRTGRRWRQVRGCGLVLGLVGGPITGGVAAGAADRGASVGAGTVTTAPTLLVASERRRGETPFGSGGLNSLDPSTGHVGPRRSLGRTVPESVVVGPGGRFAYVLGVTNLEGGLGATVTVVRTAGDRPVRSIPVPESPVALDVVPGGRHLVVLSTFDVVNQPAGAPATLTVIPTGSGPTRHIAVGHDAASLVVGGGPRTVYVLDTSLTGGPLGITPVGIASGRVGRRIRVAATAVVVSPDGRYLYALVPSRHAVVVIPTATDRPGATLTLAATGAGGGLSLSPDGRTLDVLAETATGSAVTVTPITTATLTAGAPVDLGARPAPATDANPLGTVLSAVWSPGSTTVWVLASGTASVTGALWAVTVGGAATGPVGVGDNAAAAVVAPSGATVWVLDTGTGAAGDHSGGVVPVETATGTAGTRLPTHTDAQALAVVP